MMKTDEPYEERERHWIQGNSAVVERAFQLFMETGEWPKVSSIRRWLAQSHNDVDVQAVVDSRPLFQGEVRQVHQESVSLRIRHLRHVPEAADLLNLCVMIAQQAAVVYRTPEADLRVSSTDTEVALAANSDQRLLARAGLLLLWELPSPLAGGGSTEDSWQYFINESYVLEFEGVTTPEQFVAVQDRILTSITAQRQQYGLPSLAIANEFRGEVLKALDYVPLGSTDGASKPEAVDPSEHPRVFISHASEDKERFVTEFATRLRALGVDAWVDRWEMSLGDSLVKRIFSEGIGGADAFIIVLSSESIDKPWVVKELSTAVIANIEGGCRLIPIILDGVEPPVVLSDHLWVAIPNLGSFEDELQEVVRAIYGIDEKPPLGPVPGYIARPTGIRGLKEQDARVLASLVRTALESPMGIPRSDKALAECVEAGIAPAAFNLSLEALSNAYLIELRRFSGGYYVEKVRHAGFSRYLEATRPDLVTVRRRLIALLLNEFRNGTDVAALAARLGETPKLVDVLLTELERRKLLTLIRMTGGTGIMGISDLLAREIEE
jgi:hypothetical protein